MDIGAQTRALSAPARADRPARVLQRDVGALRRAAELAAGRGLRRHHALRARGDDVRVPHPGARLPVGRACRSSPPTATRSPTWCAPSGSAWWCRPRTRTALADALEKVLYDEEFAARGPRADRRRARAVHVGDRARAAGGVLPQPGPGRGPAAGRGAAGAQQAAAASASSSAATSTSCRSYLDTGGPGELTRRAAGRVRRLAAERWKGRRGWLGRGPVRVLLDGTPLLGDRTGIGRYTAALAEELASMSDVDMRAVAFTLRGWRKLRARAAARRRGRAACRCPRGCCAGAGCARRSRRWSCSPGSPMSCTAPTSCCRRRCARGRRADHPRPGVPRRPGRAGAVATSSCRSWWPARPSGRRSC